MRKANLPKVYRVEQQISFEKFRVEKKSPGGMYYSQPRKFITESRKFTV